MNASERDAVVERGPGRLEWFLGYAAILTTALFPALAKFSTSADDATSSPLAQTLWTIIYVLAAARLFSSRELAAPLLRRVPLLWAFVLLMVLSTLWSVDPSVTWKQSIELLGTTIVATYFVLRYTLERLLDLFSWAFGSVAVMSVAFIVFSPGRGRTEYGSGPWCGIFQEKNLLGAAMVLAIITLGASLFSGSWRRRVVVGGTLLLCMALLVGSQSATSLAAGLGAVVVVLIARRWFAPRTGMLGRVFMTGFAGIAILMFATFGLRPDSAIGFLGRDTSLTGRADFWPYLLTAIGDRPELGFGYNAFFRSTQGADYLSYFTAVGFNPYHAHNSFLMIALDAGFVGLALLVGLLVVGLVRAGRYFIAQGTFRSTWPLTIVLYLVLGSYTETYLGNYNTFEWILFVAALLYPVRQAAPALARAVLPRPARFPALASVARDLS